MGDVRVFINKEGAEKVVEHPDLRFWLKRLRPEGLERHRVATWPNRACLSQGVPDATFTCALKFFFVIVLSLSVLSDIILEQHLPSDHPTNGSFSWGFILDQTWMFGTFQIGWKEITPLVIFAAVVCISVSMKKKTGSAPLRKEEVKTISGSIQQL